MAGGETHLFRVALSEGQYLRVVVVQQGIDVAVSLISPDARRLSEVDSPNGSYGAEPLSVVVAESGEHLIEVRSPDKKAQAGFYEMTVEALREPTASDRARVRAEQAFVEALRLNSQPTAQSKREALEKFEAALPVFRSLEDRAMELFTLRLAGLAYHTSGRLQPALSYYNQALSLSKALGDQRSVALLLNNIGGVYDILGEPQQALDYYGRALPLLQALNNNNVQGDALNNIGVIHYRLGDLQSALDYYNRALPFRRAGSNRRKEADTLDNIGLVHTMMGDPQRALEHLEHSLELRRAAKDMQGEANTLDNIGVAYAALRQMTKALDYYNRALLLRRTVGDRRGEAITLNNIGEAYASLLEPQKALEQHQRALELTRAIGDRHEEAYALASLGTIRALMGRPQEALEHYGKSLSTFQALGDRRFEARIRQAIATVERERGNLDEARNQIDAALSIIEAIRAQVVSPQLRTSYFASRQDAYEFYIDLLMRMHGQEPSKGHDAAALRISERARARSLLEMMSEFRVDIRQGVDPQLLERERGLSQLLNAKAEWLMRLLGQQDAKEQIAALKKEMDTLEADYQQVRGEIRRSSPRYAAITQPAPLGLREIQQLLDADTLLLEYSLGTERSYLWVVSHDSLQSYQLPGREQIELTARQLYELVTSRSLRKAGESATQRRERIRQADLQTPAVAAKLSRFVLEPSATELKGKRLVVVADGALQYIPFAMLPVPDVNHKPESIAVNSSAEADVARAAFSVYRPLIVEHEIVSLPSASALAVQRKELSGRKVAPNKIAVIADPVFEGTDSRVRSKSVGALRPEQDESRDSASTRTLEHLTEQTGKLRIARLSYTRSEAKQILSVAAGEANLSALDFSASRATVLGGELHKYRYIHFATHGYLDSEKPGLSAVVLSLVNERGEQQDGFLRTQEIYNLSLPAELVVLSACQTGLGKEIKGEGLVGLTRGFMYAGASRIIVSMWNVSDKGTADLMARLYQGMIQDGLRPAAALRAAQLALWKQKQWQSPYYWAAFVQQGEWR
ncbi:MAG TPA: CHAT domain-containing tetratricopeptide repeat protein [Pyrinomonadaceae bacterium]|nr:CHAT domain-containing tetratricopeptide repeat protein [Pyrinomonadaceae bacterium]